MTVVAVAVEVSATHISTENCTVLSVILYQFKLSAATVAEQTSGLYKILYDEECVGAD